MWISSGRPGAVARIAGGKEYPCLYGTVKLYPRGKQVLVVVEICGLPKSETGFFALHIHEGTSCDGSGFSDSGGHFNPKNLPHPCHAGDLPNLLCSHGSAFMAVMTDRFTISQVLGKTVIIHSGPDDYRSQPSGDPGKKIACGILCSC